MFTVLMRPTAAGGGGLVPASHKALRRRFVHSGVRCPILQHLQEQPPHRADVAGRSGGACAYDVSLSGVTVVFELLILPDVV